MPGMVKQPYDVGPVIRQIRKPRPKLIAVVIAAIGAFVQIGPGKVGF